MATAVVCSHTSIDIWATCSEERRPVKLLGLVGGERLHCSHVVHTRQLTVQLMCNRPYAIPHVTKRETDSGRKSGYYAAILSGKEDCSIGA